ncbi:cobalamin B12-binding domain-containing protein [Actinomadura formosensis]|uniref:cobalamin B12-binding domain-containing protein n=1 Tax=Actinomadura formosensis TaxID=60706 RepID=UPI000A00CB61|nr:cobalamin-dependent protein [Actinomadura formosensis]
MTRGEQARPHADLDAWTARLWDAVIVGDEYAATDAAVAALDEGMDAETLLLDVIAPLQARVGSEWAANRLTVVQEHTATAVIERVIAALALHPAVRRRQRGEPRGRIAVACIDGEWHALPARIVAEVLRLRGWQVDYLGAQVPTPHLISHLHRTGPALVALSSSIATRLPAAHAAITACQATGTPVLVGGAAFGPDGRYAALLGADGWAPNARAAADLLADGPLRKPKPAHQPVDDLPHLADQEYARVTGTAHRLVRRTMDELQSRFPAMADYTEQQRRHTAEDIAHIVDFLGTALYLDDPDLFTGFITWTAGILTARDVPARSLVPALDLLAEQLAGLPRATDLLRRAQDALRRPAPPAADEDSGVLAEPVGDPDPDPGLGRIA